jgi:hypothetical protein
MERKLLYDLNQSHNNSISLPADKIDSPLDRFFKKGKIQRPIYQLSCAFVTTPNRNCFLNNKENDFEKYENIANESFEANQSFPRALKPKHKKENFQQSNNANLSLKSVNHHSLNQLKTNFKFVNPNKRPKKNKTSLFDSPRQSSYRQTEQNSYSADNSMNNNSSMLDSHFSNQLSLNYQQKDTKALLTINGRSSKVTKFE